MKIGFYCESPADRAALTIFTEGVLGQPPDPISMDLQAHSVPALFRDLDGVFRGVHYHSDAEALVFVVDCDDAEIHDQAHDAPGANWERCRFCQARNIIAQARKQLKTRHGKPELKVAIGVAVPAIEAWYLVGKNHEVGEAAWLTGLKAGRPPFTRSELKKKVYGTDRPSLELETKHAKKEAHRIHPGYQGHRGRFPSRFRANGRGNPNLDCLAA